VVAEITEAVVSGRCVSRDARALVSVALDLARSLEGAAQSVAESSVAEGERAAASLPLLFFFKCAVPSVSSSDKAGATATATATAASLCFKATPAPAFAPASALSPAPAAHASCVALLLRARTELDTLEAAKKER